jgi:hypothetical protein
VGLKIGDRVVIKQETHPAKDETGVVKNIIYTNTYPYTVELDEYNDFVGTSDVFRENDLEFLGGIQPETVRGQLLLEAKQLIEGDRNVTYGEPTQNFTNIAGMWNILFAHKLTEDFTPRDIAQAMIALKQCRTITQPKRDNFVDIAGYAAIGWEAEDSGN